MLATQTAETMFTDPYIRPPASDEVRAAEHRTAKQLPIILDICRKAIRSGDLNKHVKEFANRNGLSSYGRVTLTAQCRIYQQGVTDGRR